MRLTTRMVGALQALADELGVGADWRLETAAACPICLALGIAVLPPGLARASDPAEFDRLMLVADRRRGQCSLCSLCRVCRRAAATLDDPPVACSECGHRHGWDEIPGCRCCRAGLVECRECAATAEEETR